MKLFAVKIVRYRCGESAGENLSPPPRVVTGMEVDEILRVEVRVFDGRLRSRRLLTILESAFFRQPGILWLRSHATR